MSRYNGDINMTLNRKWKAFKWVQFPYVTLIGSEGFEALSVHNALLGNLYVFWDDQSKATGKSHADIGL